MGAFLLSRLPSVSGGRVETLIARDSVYGSRLGGAEPTMSDTMVSKLVEHRQQGVDALVACAHRLRQEVPVGTPMLCLGFSAGGMVALDYGRSGADVAGIILCSALLKTAAEGMNTHIRAPVLVLQGTQDQVAPMETIAAVIAEMDQAGNDVRFELYSQTHHAFDNPEVGTDPNARLVYSPNSARHARAAIASFLTEIAGRS